MAACYVKLMSKLAWLICFLGVVSMTSCTKEASNPIEKKAAVPTLLAEPIQQRFLLNEMIKLKPSAGHHFNLEAPNQCGKMPWIKKTPTLLQCQLTEAGPLTITVSICDDKKSFCKVEKHEVMVGDSAGAKEASRAHPFTAAAAAHEPLKGWLLNDPDAALARAKKDRKLLLIDFYGAWCPPCNLLDEMVFNQPDFEKAAKNLVLVQLDADSQKSWDWKDHFKIGGYPTVVLADASLQEVGRVVGYRPVQQFVKWLKEQEKFGSLPLEKVKAEITKRPEQAKRLGQWHLERNEYEEAIRAFLIAVSHSKGADPDAERSLYLARALATKEQGEKEKTLQAMEKLVEKFPGDIEVVNWVTEILDLDETKGRTLVSKALASMDKWRGSPELSRFDYTVGDLWQVQGDLLERIGDEKGARNAFALAAEDYAAMVKASPLKLARGANLQLAYCLYKSGQVEKAKKLYSDLATHYADEFTFNYNYAHLLMELKDYASALPLARKASERAYGDNWLRAVWLTAKLESLLGKTADARRTLEEALAQVAIPKQPNVRTHGYVARLRALLKTI